MYIYVKVKIKVKFNLEQATKAQREVALWLYCFSTLALEEVGGKHHVMGSLPSGKRTGTHLLEAG
jgi:hypothetical protein